MMNFKKIKSSIYSFSFLAMQESLCVWFGLRSPLPFSLALFSNWSMADLQCCSSFKCTARLLILCICVSFFRFFFVTGYYKIWNGSLSYTVDLCVNYLLYIDGMYLFNPQTHLSFSVPLVASESLLSICLWVLFWFINITFWSTTYVISYDTTISRLTS